MSISGGDSEVHDEPWPPPAIKGIQAAMDVMQQYSLDPESTDVAIQLTRVCSSVAAATRNTTKQTKINDCLLVQSVYVMTQ